MKLFEGLRDKFPILIMIFVVISTAIAVIYTKHSGRVEFVALQKLEQQRDRLNEEWGRLLLEQSTWAGQGRVERQAYVRLNMIVPTSNMIVVITP
ncbi:MAG: cell division protein FtsL [Methylophagaceae bacterium]